MSPRDINPEELLSAYADGDLTVDEQRAVEAYLSRDPAARDELERFRDTLREVKSLSPSVRDEPSWDDIAAAISREVDAVEAERANTWPRRLWSWVKRPRVVAGFGMAAVAAAAIAVFVLRSGSGDTQSTQSPPPDQIAAIELDPDFAKSLIPADGNRPEQVAELDDLDEAELDALLVGLSLDGDDESQDDVLGDLLGADDDILSPQARDEWTGGDSEIEYATGLGVDMFEEVNYDWLDDLDEDALDALDRYLSSIQAG